MFVNENLFARIQLLTAMLEDRNGTNVSFGEDLLGLAASLTVTGKACSAHTSAVRVS